MSFLAACLLGTLIAWPVTTVINKATAPAVELKCEKPAADGSFVCNWVEKSEAKVSDEG